MNTASPSFPVSVMDFQWPGDFPALVQALDRLGYDRFWATEHHSRSQSGSPTVVAALSAGLTRRIRVGTAAVLLQYRSPLQVAEEFRLLELLFPGRLDLGVSSLLLGDPVHGMLLDGRPDPTPGGFEARAFELARLTRGGSGPTGLLDGDLVGPTGNAGSPQLWICGTSPRSAALAGRLGASYAFHQYLSQDRFDGAAIIRAYHDAFVPNAFLSQPRSAVACYGVAASTRAEAERQWKLHAGRPVGPGPTPSFLGDADQCCEQVAEIHYRHAVSEVVIQCMINEIDRRIDAYERMADAFALGKAVG